jgi:hypothetical protein
MLPAADAQQSVATRAEALGRQPAPVKHGRAHARRKVTRKRIADALLQYYSESDSPIGDAGFYRAITAETELSLSILTMPNWLDAIIRLDSESEQYHLRPDARRTSINALEGAALEEALNKLASAEEAGTVLYNSPLYCLLDVGIDQNELATTFGVSNFVSYALTTDLLEGELVQSLAGDRSTDTLALRDAYLPTIASALAFENDHAPTDTVLSASDSASIC